MILRFQLIQVNAVNDFENAVILIMCVIKNNDNSHRQLFWEEGLVSQDWWEVKNIAEKLVKVGKRW